MRTKDEIRRAIAAERNTLDPDRRATASAEIVNRVSSLPAFREASFVGLYLAIDGEVILDELLATCWNAEKRTAIPVFNRNQQIYEMAEITSATEFRVGHYGIREPISPSLVPMARIDLIAVPGVAFDRSGGRLGRGGGYYDRLLSGFHGVAAAVAFDFQLIDAVPVGPHDLPVDVIATERGIVEVSNGSLSR